MPPGLLRPIVAGLLARTTLNIAIRLTYAFLPIIARGLGVPLEAAAVLVTIRSAAGFSSLLVGPLADRYRRRTLLVGALVLFTAGAVLAGSVPLYLPFAVGFIAMGLAKTIFDPTLTAYLSDRLPYSARGRVLGIFEIPWAAAGLIGVPLVGWIIERRGWQAPFHGLAVLGVLSVAVSIWAFRGEARRRLPMGNLLSSYGIALAVPSVRWVVVMMAALLVSHEVVFIIYGAWLESAFGLGAAALGLVSIATGIAELIGEGLSSAFLDRIGKKRALIGSFALLALTYPALPVLGGLGLTGAVVGLFLLLLIYEFAIISCMPLVSELAPSARATTISISIASMGAGRILGSLIGPFVWTSVGLTGNVLLAAAFCLISLLALIRRVHEAPIPDSAQSS